MPLVKFFYVSRKTEDGGAEVDFYTDKEAAQLACDIEEKAGRALPNNKPKSIELEFSTEGLLLSPDATVRELRQKLIDTAMAQPQPEVKTPEPVVDQFSRASRPITQPAPAQGTPLPNITSLDGKVVAFAGKLSISRPRMKDYARTLGVRVAGAVTENTDILVIGEDAGMKLERAQENGTLVITEAQWLELAKKFESNKPKPGFGI
jgi:NAD-dependent DNA ligase